jgi:Na+/H+ antiporter NhaD/arsenite permease-like protein
MMHANNQPDQIEYLVLLLAIVAIFIVAYAAIALEHPINVNKAASALAGAGLLWTIYALGMSDPQRVGEELDATLISTARIVFFLLGAMTIVEVIDAHDGFEIVTSRIRTRNLRTLMWLVCIVSFSLSAILDNLTTTIVMISLIQKLLVDRDERLLFASMIVIAANAGGAWSPIGDVTTTMLWIGGQITAVAIVKALLLPSAVNMLVPLVLLTRRFRRQEFVSAGIADRAGGLRTSPLERNVMFGLGISVLVLVPAFKRITNLPPSLGVLFGLGLLWLAGEIVHWSKEPERKKPLTVAHALTQIDLVSIVFFVGILLAVGTLEHAKLLATFAAWLDRAIGNQAVIVLVLGLISAVVDNVPLVAASMGMYELSRYPVDSFLWEFVAYCAGTGGSILIIGSAAGVAAMGLEKIQFIWYMRMFSGLAVLGYFSGAAIYLAQYWVFH